jgi:hypothetical protein
MFRVFSMVFLFGTGTFGLVLLKNTIVFFVNLTLDSIKSSGDHRRITTSDARKDIYKEFFERISWVPRQFKHGLLFASTAYRKRFSAKYRLLACAEVEKDYATVQDLSI